MSDSIVVGSTLEAITLLIISVTSDVIASIAVSSASSKLFVASDVSAASRWTTCVVVLIVLYRRWWCCGIALTLIPRCSRTADQFCIIRRCKRADLSGEIDMCLMISIVDHRTWIIV